jgi:hypothetical protein
MDEMNEPHAYEMQCNYGSPSCAQARPGRGHEDVTVGDVGAGPGQGTVVGSVGAKARRCFGRYRAEHKAAQSHGAA